MRGNKVEEIPIIRWKQVKNEMKKLFESKFSFVTWYKTDTYLHRPLGKNHCCFLVIAKSKRVGQAEC